MLVPQLLPIQPRPAPATPRKAGGAAGAASAAHGATASHHPAAAAAPDPDPEQIAALELALMRREQTFDLATKQQAENEREANLLRDLAMAQIKKDDENLKKWIAMV